MGFLAGKSCVTQLLEFLEDVTSALDKGEDVDVIYLDLSKAFDRVPHKRLLRKLWGYGIRGNIHSWIKDFLRNRKQQVNVNGKLSKSQSQAEFPKVVFWGRLFSFWFLPMTCRTL